LVRLTSGNSIDITEAIWFSAGGLPALRTLGNKRTATDHTAAPAVRKYEHCGLICCMAARFL
jgi:hypothetical protein